MTGSSRSLARTLAVLFALSLALIATFAISPTTALAEGGCESQYEGECPQPQSEPDACPDLPGMQTAGANCTPAPAPESAPSPTPVQADSTPDEGFVAPPAEEHEHGSLTIQTAQVDPPTTTGGEAVIPGAFEAEAPGGGTSAAANPSGPLPYTGAVATSLAIAGVSLLWIGALSHLVAGVLRRRVAADAA